MSLCESENGIKEVFEVWLWSDAWEKYELGDWLEFITMLLKVLYWPLIILNSKDPGRPILRATYEIGKFAIIVRMWLCEMDDCMLEIKGLVGSK